jgi:predicted transposase/invertase (TIGR01784 family)
VDFNMLAGQRYHSKFQVREQHDRALLTEHLELHVLELPKLGEALARNDEPELALWGKFLSATTDAEIEALAKEHPVLKQAKEALETLSDDPSARTRAEMREMAQISYRLDMGKAWRDGLTEGEAKGRAEGEAKGRTEGEAKGRAEGEAKGRAEGEAKGRAEILRKLLALKFGDLPEHVTLRLAGANEADLDQWLERALAASTLHEVL